MEDSSSIMSEDDQGIEKTKRHGCHNEHVDRRNVGQMVVQKATPGRGGDFGPPRQTEQNHQDWHADAVIEPALHVQRFERRRGNRLVRDHRLAERRIRRRQHRCKRAPVH
jgi:hypothetical protein